MTVKEYALTLTIFVRTYDMSWENSKNYKMYNNEQKEQVFASNSKFYLKSIRMEVILASKR